MGEKSNISQKDRSVEQQKQALKFKTNKGGLAKFKQSKTLKHSSTSIIGEDIEGGFDFELEIDI